MLPFQDNNTYHDELDRSQDPSPPISQLLVCCWSDNVPWSDTTQMHVHNYLCFYSIQISKESRCSEQLSTPPQEADNLAAFAAGTEQPEWSSQYATGTLEAESLRARWRALKNIGKVTLLFTTLQQHSLPLNPTGSDCLSKKLNQLVTLLLSVNQLSPILPDGGPSQDRMTQPDDQYLLCNYLQQLDSHNRELESALLDRFIETCSASELYSPRPYF